MRGVLLGSCGLAAVSCLTFAAAQETVGQDRSDDVSVVKEPSADRGEGGRGQKGTTLRIERTSFDDSDVASRPEAVAKPPERDAPDEFDLRVLEWRIKTSEQVVLRKWDSIIPRQWSGGDADGVTEDLVEVARLTREIKRLRREREGLAKALNDPFASAGPTELSRLQSENKRLRELVGKLVGDSLPSPESPRDSSAPFGGIEVLR